MHVAERSASGVQDNETKWAGAIQAPPSVVHLDVVLKPLSRPELGEIRIDDAVFAIGRSEQPFASYGSDILAMLSRRHARMFRENGFVYLADLESRNGTTVNRVAVRQAPCQLRDGDEICFGGALSYRAQITPRALKSRIEGGLMLTLTPESGDSGLDPIVITKFPFLVGKGNATFSRYKNKNEHGRERGYLSRRHAYVYQKGGRAYIEDLASGNGTFVDGLRLEEHAVPLHDGVLVAFGGDHFVYRVGITGGSDVEPAPSVAGAPIPEGVPAPIVAGAPIPEGVPAPSVTGAPMTQGVPASSVARAPIAQDAPTPSVSGDPMAEGMPSEPPANDKTQFMAAPTSFLEIFCVADEAKDDVAPNDSKVPAAAAKEQAVKRRPRGRAMLLLSELAALLASDEPESTRRNWWRAAAVAGILAALALTAYFWSASERDLKDAVARGDYARAAAVASRLLEKHPDDVDLKARATEAALKANVPAWLAKVRAHDFDGAKGVLTGMSELGTRDADLRPLIDELEWLGNLERLVSDRGGPETAIRIYADEDNIERLIGRWNDDTGEHQRALARIASHVPQFGDWYSEALTHVRRLQSESSVYLPVIQRVKATITTELGRDNPDALEPVLKETAEKYPDLGGLDSVRQDLKNYIEIRREARALKSGRLFALLRKAGFVTPPFQKSVHALTESGQLPPADLLQQYDVSTQAWKDGNASQALAGLQKMATGAWGEAAAHELERKQDVTARFVALQRSRNEANYVEQLLAFRESLDADEDVYFLRATAADLNLHRDKVIARARDAMNRARTLWQEYRSNGAIDASMRIETSISDQFRTRARLLADATRYAQQGFLIFSQVDAAEAGQWTAIRNEIESEARQQRSALHDLSNVVEPALLKTKLELLGDLNQ
jgi:pSer/pThr/pTyr-binding forkhead associated (FHA) protein